MEQYVAPIAKLIEEFSKLPGVGRKTAQRLAFHVLDMKNEEVLEFAKSVVNAKKYTKYCSVCGNLTDDDPCTLCKDNSRDRSIICVVEDSRDIMAMERTCIAWKYFTNGWYRTRRYKHKRVNEKTR